MARFLTLALLAVSRLALAASFGAPVVVSGDDANEPGINVATDGTIYVNAPPGLPTASFVYRSVDGGATWVKPAPGPLRGTLPGGGDCNISLDPLNGTVYMIDLWLGSATASVSHDRARSWLANPLGGAVAQDRPWIATTGGGVAYVVTHQLPVGLVVSKSVDGGMTYPVSTVAATVVDQAECECPPGNLIAQAGGSSLGRVDRVGVIYTTAAGGVRFARSLNGGVSFASADVQPASSADTGQAFPVVANAGNDALVAVWVAATATRSRVMLSRSRDWGATWTAPRTLVGTGTSIYPWVDARGAKVAVSLYRTTARGTADTVAGSALWYETYLESVDGGATFSATQIVDPLPVKKGPICTGGISCTSGRELGDFQSCTLDPLARANLAWTRSLDNQSNTEIRFVREN